MFSMTPDSLPTLCWQQSRQGALTSKARCCSIKKKAHTISYKHLMTMGQKEEKSSGRASEEALRASREDPQQGDLTQRCYELHQKVLCLI